MRYRDTLILLTVLAGGCSPPPGLTEAQPPGVDPRRKLARDYKESKAAAADTAELMIFGADTPRPTPPPAPPTSKGEVKSTDSGVKYETLHEGSGATAKAGQKVTVRYFGTLDDGRTFDSTGKKTFTTEIGANRVIQGWDEAVPGMKVGEVRKLTIPPAAGYGARGTGNVPPNATLHFEIELIEVE